MNRNPLVGPPLWTRNFFLLCLANFLMFTAFYFLIPVLPVFIVDELGGHRSMVGVILAAYTLAALVIRPFAGKAIDHLGRRMIYLVSFVIFSLLFNLYIVAGSIILLLLLRFLHGLNWGITTTSGNTLVVDLIPPARRGEGIGIFGLSFTLAMAIGPLLGLLILKDGRFSLVFFVGFLVCLAGWIMALLVRYPGYERPNGKKLSLNGLLERKSLPVSLALLMLNVTYGGVISFIALYAQEVGVGNPGLFFLLYATGVMLTRTSAGRVFDRRGPDYLVGFGASMLAFGFIVLSQWKSVPGFFTAAVLLGSGGGVVMPTFTAMVNNMIGPDRRGAANSTLYTALDLGIGGGMLLTGFLSELMGLGPAYLLCSLLCLATLAVYFAWVGPHYRKNLLPLHFPQDSVEPVV